MTSSTIPPRLPRWWRRTTPRPQTAKAFRLLLENHLDQILEWDSENIEGAARGFCEENDWPPKELFMPVRVALTGTHRHAASIRDHGGSRQGAVPLAAAAGH